MLTAAAPRSRLNPVSIIFLKVFIMGVVGIPIAYLFDRQGFEVNFAAKLEDVRFIGKAFVSVVAAFLIMAALYYALGIKRRMVSYMRREFIAPTENRLYWLWLITFVLSILCFLYVFIQLGGRHPALQALGSDYQSIKMLRRETGQALNLNVFNIGFKLFLPFNLILALFFVRKRHALMISSVILFLVMSTLLLEKGQIISAVLLVVFFRMLTTSLSLRKIALYGLIALGLLSAMYFLTRFASNLSSLWEGLSNRIFYGEISDLPVYFEIFEDQRVPPESLLPPYLAHILGKGEPKPAARLAMERISPAAVKLGTAGVANTFFTGEAFAAWGSAGVWLSPFLVMANLTVFVYLFGLLKKSVVFVFLYSWFLYKVFESIMSGISYFLFSGVHLVLLALLYVVLGRTFAAASKANGKKAAA